MTPDRATRRLVDLQALLGVGALCLAEGNAALAAASAAAYAAIRLGQRAGPGSPLPLPGWASNAGALLAVALLVLEARRPGVELVVAMGHFTVMLQGLLLAGRRGRRDDAMLLVLSLIQVLAASVLSSRVLDGAAMMAWCAAAAGALTRLAMRAGRERVLARNASLGEAAPARPAGPPGSPGSPRPPAASGSAGVAAGPAIGRVFLPGVAVAALVAAAVFVATPRREAGVRGDDAAATLGALRGAGFAARVDLGVGAPQRVNDGPVLHVTIRQGGGNIGRDGRDFLLRGAALDRYEPWSRSWIRGPAVAREDVLLRLPPGSGGAMSFTPGSGHRSGALTAWEVEAVQRGGGVSTLFLPTDRMMAAGTPLSLRVPGLRSLSFNPVDRRLQAVDRQRPAPESWRVTVAPLRDPGLAASYRRFEPLHAGPRPDGSSGRSGARWLSWLRPLVGGGGDEDAGAAEPEPQPDAAAELLAWEVEPRRVEALARNVLAAAGLERGAGAAPGPDDRRRVERLEHFLRTNFEYTLTNPRLPEGRDPVIHFLFDERAGHCELFAAGLVALCRSVGIPARIATGYRAGEFNAAGGYYVVRPEHAHAWAEAALGGGGRASGAGEGGGDAGADAWPTGWTTFDATPPARVAAEHERGGPAWLRRLRHLYEHAEYTWISRVVAFGPETRQRAFAAIRASAVTLFSDRVGWTRFLPTGPWWRVGGGAAAVLLAAAGCGVAVWVLRRHRAARRRAAARPAAFATGSVLGARRLNFYARLLEVLERQGLERPAAATPAAWARGLAASDPRRFAGVPTVTEAFYRVRFGGLRPDAAEARRIDRILQGLAAPPPPPEATPPEAGAAS